jgi:signal transduction histidine kinase
VPGASLRAFAAIAVHGNTTVWTQRDPETLLELRVVDGSPATITSTHHFPRKEITAIACDPSGRVWVGFLSGGIATFHAGRWTELDAEAGLTSGRMGSLTVDGAGYVWAAGASGLSRVGDGRVATMTAANGLPCGVLRDTIRDSNGNLWVASACGLLSISRKDVDAWWADPTIRVAVRTLDHLDGFPSRSTYAPANQRSARTSDGRLWFVLDGPGVGIIDPAHIRDRQVEVPVRIERLSADGVARREPALPPHTRDVRIEYTALAYTAPQRVRFRYRLEGFDTGWHDVVNIRQATYTNLPPGEYRFEVAAAVGDGAWSATPATFAFVVLPAFYQTTWFALVMTILVGAIAWAVYTARMRSRVRQMNRLFEERLAERTRIAQELHDTLIQDLTAVGLRAELVDDQLPSDPVPAKQTLASLRQDLGRTIARGRAAMATLRFEPSPSEPLGDALRRAVDELGTKVAVQPSVVVTVSGNERPISPSIHEELYRIGREAIVNALQHADATNVIVELTFAPTSVRLRVKDDGKGFDEVTIEARRPGHFGLQGIRERAARIGAVVQISTSPGAGTEVIVIVPPATHGA